MNKKLLIGIIVVIVVLMIAIAISGSLGLAMTVPEIALVGGWIYLVWMIRKKKTEIFSDQTEPKLAERRYKRLKVFLLAAGISLAVGIIGTVLHAVLGILLEIEEDPVSFFIAIIGYYAFVIATIGSLVIFLKGRWKTT